MHVRFSLLVPEAANDTAFDFSSSAGYTRCQVDFSAPKAYIVTPVIARYSDVHVIFGQLKPKAAKMAGGGRYLGG